MARPLRYSLARIGRWPRLLAALACLMLAAVSALDARQAGSATPVAARTARVVVSARALPAGHILVRRDLSTVRWPAKVTPSGAGPDLRRLVGQRLAGPMDAGEPVTQARLVGAALTRGLAAGTVATPIDLDTDVRAFVHPGDRVDVVAIARPDTDPFDPGSNPESGPDKASGRGGGTTSAGALVARRLLVLAVYRAADSSPPTAQVVVATPRDLALRIAGLRSTRLFTIVIDSP